MCLKIALPPLLTLAEPNRMIFGKRNEFAGKLLRHCNTRSFMYSFQQSVI
jgi:hypothetical protein